LGAIVAELAAEWGEAPAAAASPCLRLVRVLLENGFAAPVDPNRRPTLTASSV
jgi:hypothetical protein